MDIRSEVELEDAKARMRPVVVDILHLLRGGGLPNPMVALEQLSFLLLLLYLDRKRWVSELVLATNENRFATLRNQLFPEILRKPPVGGSALLMAMAEATFAFPSPELLDLVVQRLEDIPRSEYMCADLLDAALDEVSATSSVGSPRTPSAVSDCMIALTEPGAGDRVFDPAAGAGDRLLAVIRREGFGSASSSALVGGVDPDATIVRLGVMSLVFHGIQAPNLYTRNVLVDPRELPLDPSDSTGRFEVILCQPPFGNRIDPSMLAPEFGELPSARSEVLFAEFTLERVAEDGRAAIVLPVSVASSKAAAPSRLRARLLDRLRAVIALPQGTFQPHTNVETFIVALGGDTDHVVFIDARDAERGQTSQSMEIMRRSGAIVDDLLNMGLPVEELPPEDRGRVFVVNKREIRESDFSLLASTYRPPREMSDVTDSPLMLFREIERTEVEIARHLDVLGQRLAERSAGNG